MPHISSIGNMPKPKPIMLAGSDLLKVLEHMIKGAKASTYSIRWIGDGKHDRNVSVGDALRIVKQPGNAFKYSGKVSANRRRVHTIKEHDVRPHLRDDDYLRDRAVIKYHKEQTFRQHKWVVNANGQNVLVVNAKSGRARKGARKGQIRLKSI